MTTATPSPGAAFMGYAKWPKGGLAVRVCAWCPDAAKVEAWANPVPVTHGICPGCYQRFMVHEPADNPLELSAPVIAPWVTPEANPATQPALSY